MFWSDPKFEGLSFKGLYLAHIEVVLSARSQFDGENFLVNITESGNEMIHSDVPEGLLF